MRFPTILCGSKLHSWTLRIRELSSNGRWQEALSFYCEMKRAGFQAVDHSVFPPVLKACSVLSLRPGKSIHACLIKQGFESFVSIRNSIADFYVKSGDLKSALEVFDCMRSGNSVSWNILIYGHVQLGVLREGLVCFAEARVAGFVPNTSTLVLVVQCCCRLKAYVDGQQLHGYIIRSGFFWGITAVQNTLLAMYAGMDMESAQKLFDEMHNKDVISWSVMIGGYVQKKEAVSGLRLFRNMVSGTGIEPDGVTLVSVLKACADLEDICEGRLVHGFAISGGFIDDLFVDNSLIDMYSKCNDVDSAFQVFNEMPKRNKVSWNSILSGFVLNEKHVEALSLIQTMRRENIVADEVTLVNVLQMCKYFTYPSHCMSVHSVILRQGHESNELVLSSLIDAYAKCGLVEIACKLFDGMKSRDVVSWSTMIAGFSHCGKPDEAIALFQEMNQAQEEPNAITIINLLETCSVSAELRRSKWAHAIAIRKGLAAEVAVGTAIVDMYSKCGAVEASMKAFDQIPHKNIVSWSALIAAYGMNGAANQALASLAEMKLHGMKPNAVTTLSVLSACSHSGLVEEGLSFFKSMARDHGVDPGLEHYSCLVDMLARAGNLDCAIEVIKTIPEGLTASASAWGALLSACRSYGNNDLGAAAVSHVLELEPLNSAGYMLASNLYAGSGLLVDAAQMRRLVKERGVRVVAGYSLVNVGDKVHRFVAGYKSHSSAGNLNNIVVQLHECIKMKETDDLYTLNG